MRARVSTGLDEFETVEFHQEGQAVPLAPHPKQ